MPVLPASTRQGISDTDVQNRMITVCDDINPETVIASHSRKIVRDFSTSVEMTAESVNVLDSGAALPPNLSRGFYSCDVEGGGNISHAQSETGGPAVHRPGSPLRRVLHLAAFRSTPKSYRYPLPSIYHPASAPACSRRATLNTASYWSGTQFLLCRPQ